MLTHTHGPGSPKAPLLRRAAQAVVGGVLATALFAGLSGTAAASKSGTLFVSAFGEDVGYGQFNADPVTSRPGDAVRACDTKGDGWGVKATITIYWGDGGFSYRSATTQGHSAPYCTSWKTGNLPEETSIQLTVCQAKGDQLRNCRHLTGLRA